MATSLRSFFRFVRAEGLRDDRLEEAVPMVPRRRLASLPRRLDRAQFTRLIASLDGSSPVDLRDWAILLCIASLGWRASEVVRLRLDLATRANMDHIHKRGGRFLSVLSATRKEDEAYRAWLVTHEPEWLRAATHASRYLGASGDVWQTTEAPWPSAEGNRIVWLRSSAARERDASNQHDAISAQSVMLCQALCRSPLNYP